jgi:DNA-binding transcriptional ArsR family regulator
MPTRTLSVPIALQAKLFRGFSDLSRLSLLNALRTGSLTVSELVKRTGLTQSNTSNHLRCLLDCNLVTCQQQGRYVCYSLSDPRVAELLTLSEELLTEVAHGVSACSQYHTKEDCC